MKILSLLSICLMLSFDISACGKLEGVYTHCKATGDRVIKTPFAIKIDFSNEFDYSLMTKYNYSTIDDFHKNSVSKEQEFLLDGIRYELPSYFPGKMQDFITYNCLDNAFISEREKIFFLENKTQFEKVEISRVQDKLIVLLEMHSEVGPVAIQKIVCSED